MGQAKGENTLWLSYILSGIAWRGLLASGLAI
jgi:hypothetical protein